MIANCFLWFALAVAGQQPQRPMLEIREPHAKVVFGKAATDASGAIFVSGTHVWDQGIWRSTDHGKSWDVFPWDPDSEPGEPVPDPSNPSVVYKAAANGSLEKSVDGGRNWRKILDAPSGPPAVDGGDPRVVVAVLGDGSGRIVRSANGGGTWDVVSENRRLQPDHVQLDPSGSGRGFVIGLRVEREPWLVTEDRGLTWKPITAPGIATGRPVFHPNRPGTLYVPSDDRIYWSTDLENWRILPAPGRNTSSIFFDSREPGKLWLADASGIWHGDAATGSWTLSTGKGAMSQLSGCGSVEAVTPSGVLLQFDGLTWQESPKPFFNIRYGAACTAYSYTGLDESGFLSRYTASGDLLWRRTHAEFRNDWAVGKSGDFVSMLGSKRRSSGRRVPMSAVELRDRDGNLTSTAELRGGEVPDSWIIEADGSYRYSATVPPFGPSIVVKAGRDGSIRYAPEWDSARLLAVDGIGRSVIYAFEQRFPSDTGVWVLNESNGQWLAQIIRSRSEIAALQFAEDGTVFAVEDSALTKYEAGTWRLVWRTPLAKPALLDRPTIAVLDGDAGAFVDMKTGVLHWVDSKGEIRKTLGGEGLDSWFGFLRLENGGFAAFRQRTDGSLVAERITLP